MASGSAPAPGPDRTADCIGMLKREPANSLSEACIASSDITTLCPLDNCNNLDTRLPPLVDDGSPATTTTAAAAAVDDAAADDDDDVYTNCLYKIVNLLSVRG